MGSVGTKVARVLGAFAVGVCLSFLLTRVPTPAGRTAARQDGAQGESRCRYGRVICMSPAISEIVFALGAGPRVVGVSQHTRWPPEALAKSRCGGFFNPSYERILALEPDLLITQGEAAKLTGFARDNGIDIVSLALWDLESIFTETERIGHVLEIEAQAELVCAEMRHRLAEVKVRVSGKPPVPVLLVTGRDPGSLSNIQAVGGGTFLHDLIEVAGGRNVASDIMSGYGVINKEKLLERAPDVIVELRGEGMNDRAKSEEVRKLWEGLWPLPAVQQGRVHVIEATYAMIPGPRVVQLAGRLADLFHGGDG